MFSCKKLVFVLALLLVTLLPNVVARPAFAQEGVEEEGVQVEEGVEDGLGCVTSSYSVYAAPYSVRQVGRYITSSGCGGTVRVTANPGTYMRATADGRSPGSWVQVPGGQTRTIAAWLPAGIGVTVEILHYNPNGVTFKGQVTR